MLFFDCNLFLLPLLVSLAQKMAVNHLADRCQEIPEEIKERLKTLKETTRSSDGGGKRYWAEALRTLGVRELEAGGLVWNE